MKTALIAALALTFVLSSIILIGEARQKPQLASQTVEDVLQKSEGCVSAGCHAGTESMHASPAVHIGCTDCHGGNAVTRDKAAAHVRPINKEIFRTSANPERPYTTWLREPMEYVRFVNPGDLRVQEQTCGSSSCHEEVSYKVRKSMMTHGGMLWGAALYGFGLVAALLKWWRAEK